MEFINKIICGDCLEVMKQMPDESVDLVVTSPPYNLKNSTGNGMKAGTKTGKWKNKPLQNGYAHHDDDAKYWARKITRSVKEDSWDTPQGVVVMEKTF